MFELIPPPTVFAHRGASQIAPENTLAAFELAIHQGAPAIELDAMLSADSAVVVIHDHTVDRTTNGHGSVKELSLAELKTLDAGSYIDVSYRGEKIPTLDDVFEVVGKRVYINVELKNYVSPLDSLPNHVAKIVRRHNLERSVMFSSFNPIALLRIRRLLPECPIGLLALPGAAGFWARSWMSQWIGYQALHPAVSDITPDLIQNVHKHNKRVHVYTVNQEPKMRQLFRMGVDGIFTDDPALAIQILATEIL